MEIKSSGRYCIHAQLIMKHDGYAYYQEMPIRDGYNPPEKMISEKDFDLRFSKEGSLYIEHVRVEGVDLKNKKVHLTAIKSGGVPIAGVGELIDDLENCIGTFQEISAVSDRV